MKDSVANELRTVRGSLGNLTVSSPLLTIVFTTSRAEMSERLAGAVKVCTSVDEMCHVVEKD